MERVPDIQGIDGLSRLGPKIPDAGHDNQAQDKRWNHLLITGGAGFISSHTAVVLLDAGHELLVFDDFSNSSPIALERVREIALHP